MLKKIVKRIPCTESFLKWMLPRGMVMAVVLIASVFFIGYAPRIETGLVDCKMVTGCKEQCSHILMLKTTSKAVLLAEEIKIDMLRDTGFFVIDEELEGKISSSYTNVGYCISVRKPGSSSTAFFSVPREIFNSVRTNSFVKLEIQGPRSNKVRRVVNQMADISLRNDGHFPEYNGLRHFMSQ
ncbi:MAG: hypothetical protein JSW49_05230 [candidate division WOR-3 bacterium]|nr:MAG: hypothetical protein JSW49_05230 [candidate division WOR-3 bacterium]